MSRKRKPEFVIVELQVEKVRLKAKVTDAKTRRYSGKCSGDS